MNKEDVGQITVIESTALIISSILLGFLVGYFSTLVTMSIFAIFAEFPVDYSVDWVTLLALVGMGLATVFVGTKMSLQVVNKKKISQILRGD